jgi:hypothetical protein
LKNSGFEVFEAYFKISFSSFNSTISTLLFLEAPSIVLLFAIGLFSPAPKK